MAKKVVKKGVNLLTETKQPKTQWDKFYEFTVGTGRVIILVVMAIVLGAFIWRFSLDRKVIDLESELEAKFAVLDNLKDVEEDARELQQLIDDLETLRNNQPKKSALYASLLAARTDGTTIDSFSLTNTSLALNLESENNLKFTEAENTYKLLPILTDVLVPNSETKGDPNNPIYVFNIVAKINEEIVNEEIE